MEHTPKQQPVPVATPRGCPAGENPFRVNRIHGLAYTDPALDWDALWARLEALDYRGALVGPHGNGKSTLMTAIQHQLEACGMPTCSLVLTEEAPRVTPAMWERVAACGCDSVIILDGAEQLGPFGWRRFLRRTRHCRGVLITVHQPGRLPTLHTCRSSPALLDTLLAQLCPDLPPAWRAAAQRLYHEKSGDLRQVFLALYDQVATGQLEIPGAARRLG